MDTDSKGNQYLDQCVELVLICFGRLSEDGTPMPHVGADTYHELYFIVVYYANLWVNILNIQVRKCTVGVTNCSRHIVLPFNPLKQLGFKPQLLPWTDGFYIYNILKFIHACIMH